MRKFLCAFLVLLLCGCQPTEVISDEGLMPTPVYYISADSLLAPQDTTISVVTKEAEVRTLFSALQKTPADPTLSPAVPTRVFLESFSLRNRTLTLHLSDEYDTVTGMARTLSDAALTLSFCSLDTVDNLIIQTASYESSSFSPSDFVLTSPGIMPTRQTVDLYFVSDGALKAEPRSILLNSETSPAHSVITALLSGPTSNGLSAAIPQGTVLHSVVAEDGLCTVDLSDEFLALPEHTEAAEQLCLFSLVNTLAGLSEVEHVRILIDGASVPGFTHYDLTQAIQPEVFD